MCSGQTTKFGLGYIKKKTSRSNEEWKERDTEGSYCSRGRENVSPIAWFC
jgi:hypothetical protein